MDELDSRHDKTCGAYGGKNSQSTYTLLRAPAHWPLRCLCAAECRGHASRFILLLLLFSIVVSIKGAGQNANEVLITGGACADGQQWLRKPNRDRRQANSDCNCEYTDNDGTYDGSLKCNRCLVRRCASVTKSELVRVARCPPSSVAHPGINTAAPVFTCTAPTNACRRGSNKFESINLCHKNGISSNRLPCKQV